VYFCLVLCCCVASFFLFPSHPSNKVKAVTLLGSGGDMEPSMCTEVKAVTLLGSGGDMEPSMCTEVKAVTLLGSGGDMEPSM
ncbi:hypothetical protein LEMLEM_LOCUS7137, partial [Lemmus lemmus]